MDSKDVLGVTFYLHSNVIAASTSAAVTEVGGSEEMSVVTAAQASTSAASASAAAELPGSIVAALGSRKHEKAHWKYLSEKSFVGAEDMPWSDLGLTTFCATSKKGVLVWLQWIVEHTPRAQ